MHGPFTMAGLDVIIGVLFCIVCVLSDDLTIVTVTSTKGIVYANLHEAVSLLCYVENRPEGPPGSSRRPQVKWELSQGEDGKNWIELSKDEEAQITGISVNEEDRGAGQIYNLTIHSVTRQNAGTYQCKIQTGPESFKVDSARLIIMDPPSISPESTKAMTTHVGERNVVFTCNATGIPPPVITWTKSGGLLQQNGSSLVFDRITPEDRGIYVCEAKNDESSAFWKVTLHVTFPPIIKPLNNQPVVSQALDHTAYLICEVEANPPPDENKSTWSFNGVDITATSEKESKGRPFTTFTPKAEGATMKLTIPRVTEADFSFVESDDQLQGKNEKDYVCAATNQHGSYQAKMQLKKSIRKTEAGETSSTTRVHLSVATILSVLCAIIW